MSSYDECVSPWFTELHEGRHLAHIYSVFYAQKPVQWLQLKDVQGMRWGNVIEHSNTSFNSQRVLNLNYPGRWIWTNHIDIWKDVIKEASFPHTESKKELRTRIKNKIIALLVNKYIFLSWIILRMMYIFMLFSSVQATTCLEQTKTDVNSLFIVPWLAISCKIVDGQKLMITETLLDSPTLQPLCFCSQLNLCYE